MNAERGTGNAEWGTEKTKRGTEIAERGVGKNKRGTRNGRDKTRNAELGTRKAEGGEQENERGAWEMNEDALRKRTKEFALRVIKVAEALPESAVGRVVRNQLLRSGTSVGANYRAAKRVKSAADFISKMGTVEEEADETLYWMEIIVEAGLMEQEKLAKLVTEADEILAMVVASINTARRRK